MKTTMWKLQNEIKNYEWGSINALSELFNITNPELKPLAEVWMGAHPAGVSTAISMAGEKIKLDQLISQNPRAILGEQTTQHYPSLPYLFKILSAKEPLSVQVHPEITKAKAGFERENNQGIPLDSPNRNYKDPNHKPELVYAITPFWAMNAFRPLAEIVSLFRQLNIKPIESAINDLIENQSEIGLKSFFHYLLTLSGDLKQQALVALKSAIAPLDTVPFNVIKTIAKKYPEDSGLFLPLVLNVIKLEPGQAMFLHAQTPHAYLEGTALEIMASSDNVLRAGLTPKYIDIDELLNSTTFQSIALEHLLTHPISKDYNIDFPVPVNDFAFEIIHSQADQLHTQSINSAEILLCISGEITVSTSTDTFTIQSGESVFVANCAASFSYQGNGILARAFNH